MPSIFTENQWWCFLCGFQAGMKLRNLGGPDINHNVTLGPISVAGETTIGLGLPTLEYNESNTEILVPVYTHDVNIPYCGFSVNIYMDPSYVLFTGVQEGDFGTIGTEASSSEIRYSYSNGTFTARGRKEDAFNFSEQIILFYIKIRVVNGPTHDIVLKFNNKSDTDLNYTCLLTWKIDPLVSDEPNLYFVTPIQNIDGMILVDGKKPSEENAVGDEQMIGAPGTPSGVYGGYSLTTPGAQGVVPLYSVSNKNDDFPYNKVSVDVLIDDTDHVLTYLEVVGADDFLISVIPTYIGSYLNLHIEATRKTPAIDAITFCYISYVIREDAGVYTVPLLLSNAVLHNTYL